MKMKLVFALCWRTPPALLKSLVQVGTSADLHTKQCRYFTAADTIAVVS
jgi:hypothetical protein